MSAIELTERIATTHQVGWQMFHTLLGRGWLEHGSGFSAGITGLPEPPFNGAVVYGSFDPHELTDVLDRIIASGVPFNLQARPSVSDAVAELASERGLTPQPAMPLMALTGPPADVAVDGLTVRRLRPDENVTHAAIIAEAFASPLELMEAVTPPELVASAGVHMLAGDWHGETVATAFTQVIGDTAGIFNVATREAHRGRGIGAAVTVAAVRAAMHDGADLVFLQSSELGLGVYERIGFRRLELWSLWLSEGAA